jgi:hypothetical protein
MYSRQEVEALDVDGVVKFAQEQGLNGAAVNVLKEQEIKGKVLEDMTKDDFMKDGMKRGPATELIKALDKVFGRGECTRLRFFLLFLYMCLPPPTLLTSVCFGSSLPDLCVC